MIATCAGCDANLEERQLWVDQTTCEECDARLCDRCACDGTLGDDSYPSVYCPKCLIARALKER